MGPLDLHPFKVIYTFVCVGTHMTLVLIRKVGGLKFQKTFLIRGWMVSNHIQDVKGLDQGCPWNP